jgi:integrin alpha FG-GAP repeat containing protein 1
MHSRRTGRRKRNLLVSFVSLFLVSPAQAIWPFPPKRFTGNALIDAGSMGLDGGGRVIAFGDFDGDQLSVIPVFLLPPCYNLFP